VIASNQIFYFIKQNPPIIQVDLLNYLVDPSRVELLSRLGIDPPLFHRLSLSYPQGGERSLSRTVGCSGKVFANKSTRGNLSAHPLGFASSP